MNAITHLDKCADAISMLNCEWVLGGDFNVDLNPNSNDGKGKKLLYSFRLRNALVQLVNSPTRISVTRASILDHIYVNIPDIVSLSGTVSYGLSDHNIIFTILKKESRKKNKISFTCRNTRDYTWDLLNEILNSSDWVEFDNCNDPQQAWDLLSTILVQAVDECAPMVTLDRVKDKDPWVSANLLA